MLLDWLWAALHCRTTSDDAGISKRVRDTVQSHVCELLSDPFASQDAPNIGLDADNGLSSDFI